MKLEQYFIQLIELQDYLDKYEDKIKFMVYFDNYSPHSDITPHQLMLVIDVE